MTTKRNLAIAAAAAMLAAAAWVELGGAATTGSDTTCNQSATSSALSGSSLQSATAAGLAGVVYDATSGMLELATATGTTASYLATLTSSLTMACAADFDGDGKQDIAGTDAFGHIVALKNATTLASLPSFGATTWTVDNSTGLPSVCGMACGDVNGDGNGDIVVVSCGTTASPASAILYLGNGGGSFTKDALGSSFGAIAGTGNHVALADWSGDGKTDIIIGQSTAKIAKVKGVTTTTYGQVIAYLNNGVSPPGFNASPQILLDTTDVLMGSDGVTALAVADFNADKSLDVAVGGDNTSKLQIFSGATKGGKTSLSLSTSLSSVTGVTGLNAGDWDGDGKLDLFASTTSSALVLTNNATTNAFAAGVSSTLDSTALGYGFVIDYDGNGVNDYAAGLGPTLYVTHNGVGAIFASSGTAASGNLDLGTLNGQNIAIVDVTITPTVTLNDGTVTWEASNDGGQTWHSAATCAGSSTTYCTTFTNTSGSSLRWRATLTSSTDHLESPMISSVAVSFTYVLATKHFRSGPVASNGLVYVGAFEEPGEAGFLFAIDDASGVTQWEGGAKLDAMSTSARHLFTAAADGTTLIFSDANASDPALQGALQTTDTTSTTALIDWWTSARFGTSANPHHLGAIENSTPGVLTAPNKPYWYNLSTTSSTERTAIDTFLATYASRQNLVLVGSHDGAIHAFYTNPSSPTVSPSGNEAWAYIPYYVAQSLVSEKTSGVNTTFPDGSPTLADVKVNGTWRTVLIESYGDGGNAISALDITDTAGSTVTGPTHLWRFSDSNMGLTFSKPAVFRTKKGTTEEWLAVFASGKGATGDVGDSVYAVDMSTGSLVWRFDLDDTNCYVSTDVVALETKDETGTAIDGYVDRVVFGDNKGRLWKLDPSSDSNGTIDSMGTIDVGLAHRALFSTKDTPNALGVERAIAGSIASGVDATGKLALYFGTGGTEDTPSDAQNDFYAVYLADGTLRSKLSDNMTVAAGVKFYGGVVFNAGQLIFTSGQDLTGLGLCATSAGTINAIDANSFQAQFTVDTNAKIVAPLFAQNGEVYSVTLTGTLEMSAYTGPAQTSSGSGGGGGGSGNGNGNGNGNGGGGSGGGGGGSGSGGGGGGSGTNQSGTESDPFQILSWVQIF